MEIACPHCGKKYKVSDAAAGKKARCNNANCQQMFAIPALPAASAPKAPAAKAAPAAQPAAPVVRPAAPAVRPAAPAAPAGDGIIELGEGVAPAAATPAPALDSFLAAELGLGVPGPAVPGAATLAATPAGPLAPLPGYRRARRRGLNNPLVIAGAIGGVVALILVVVLILVFSGRGSGGFSGKSGAPVASNGLPEWAAFCVPPDAKIIGYGNVDKIRQSELFRLFERLGAQFNPAGMKDYPRAEIEKIKEVYVAATSRGDHVVIVVRTRDDTPMTDSLFLKKGQPGREMKKSREGIEYIAANNDYNAKTGPYTFCFSRHEQDIQEALGRFQRKEAPALSSELKQAMQSCRGDITFAMADAASFSQAGPMSGPGGGQPVWVGIGLSADSNLHLEGTAAFANNGQAGKVKADIDKAIGTLDQQASKAPPQARASVNKIVAMVHALRISQSGSTIQVSGQWKVKEIEDLVNQFQSMIPSGRFGRP